MLSYNNYSLLFSCNQDWTCKLQVIFLRSSLTERLYSWRHVSCGVIAKVLDCDLEVSEFELQSYYYVHFEKDMNPIIPRAVD